MSIGTDPWRLGYPFGAAGQAASPDLLFQAVSNLLDNAINYGPPESVVTLEAERIGDAVVVAVTDRGSGIPE